MSPGRISPWVYSSWWCFPCSPLLCNLGLPTQVQDVNVLLLDLAVTLSQGSTTLLGGGVGGCLSPLKVLGGATTGGPLLDLVLELV